MTLKQRKVVEGTMMATGIASLITGCNHKFDKITRALNIVTGSLFIFDLVKGQEEKMNIEPNEENKNK